MYLYFSLLCTYYNHVDIVSMKAAAQLKWPPPTPSPVELAIASCEPGRRVIIPQNAAEVKPKDMRNVYEKMRKIIYGGGARIELRNVYYRDNREKEKEKEGQGRGQSQWLGQGDGLTTTSNKNGNENVNNNSGEIKNKINPKLHTQHNTYLSMITNNERSHRMVVDMGRFVDVLARKEALRDPLLIDAHPDENSLQGLMNRKIVVDFGSRYKDEKGLGGVSSGGIDNMGGMEIETNTGVKVIRQEKVVLSGEEINKNKEENDKDKDVEKDKEKEKDKDKEKETQQMALLLDQTHTAYFMDTPLPPSDLDDEDEGEGDNDSDMLYGKSASYLYTPMTANDSDNENENGNENGNNSGNENDMDMDTDSEFDKEMEEKEKEKSAGEGEGGREGESIREGRKCRDMDRAKKSKRDRDRDPCTAGRYWNVTDLTSESSSVTIDDTNSTDSSRHIDSDTTHTHTHTLGIADRDSNSNVQAPSFTLSPLSSFFASSSSSSTPLSSPTSHTGMLALPPLGRPYASLNGKRKRLAGAGAGVGMMMGGIAMHVPTPINPSSPSIALSLSSSSLSSSPSSDAVDDGRTSPTLGIPGKGQRQGLREDQFTPHSPLPASLSTSVSTSATATASNSSVARKDQSVAPSSHLVGTSSSSSPSSSSSRSRGTADGDVTYLPITPHPPPPPSTVSSDIDGTLPAGWLQKFSNREKKNYWFNVTTGESIWVRPS